MTEELRVLLDMYFVQTGKNGYIDDPENPGFTVDFVIWVLY